jgi:hypothetical protein
MIHTWGTKVNPLSQLLEAVSVTGIPFRLAVAQRANDRLE